MIATGFSFRKELLGRDIFEEKWPVQSSSDYTGYAATQHVYRICSTVFYFCRILVYFLKGYNDSLVVGSLTVQRYTTANWSSLNEES